MTLIAASGESKAKAFEALKKVKERKFDEARALMKEAREIDIEAHNVQTALIARDLDPEQESPALSLLMVHAQDHYMTSQLARDLIGAMIDLLDTETK